MGRCPAIPLRDRGESLDLRGIVTGGEIGESGREFRQALQQPSGHNGVTADLENPQWSVNRPSRRNLRQRLTKKIDPRNGGRRSLQQIFPIADIVDDVGVSPSASIVGTS